MAYDQAKYYVLTFGVAGAPVNNQYVLPGFTAISATEARLTIPLACRLSDISVFCRVAPGGAIVDTFTVLVNGVASVAAATVTGAAVDGTWTGAVAIAADDDVSILFTTDGATAAQDPVVTLRFLKFV